jgi:hypothetical protein
MGSAFYWRLPWGGLGYGTQGTNRPECVILTGSLDFHQHGCCNELVKSLWRIRGEDMTPLQALLCVICSRPIENDCLKYVDEKGKPVHEPCYVARITKKKPLSAQFFQSKFDCFA